MAIITLNNNSLTNITSLPTGVGGKVLQVVQGISTTMLSSGSTSYVDIGLSANITPASTSNKIFITVSLANNNYRNSNVAVYVGCNLLRDTTQIHEKEYISGLQAGTGSTGYSEIYNSISMGYLDSPSSSSQLTYKVQAKINSSASSGTMRFQQNSSASTITLMEIASWL